MLNLQPLGYRKSGRPIFPIMGGSEAATEGGEGGNAGQEDGQQQQERKWHQPQSEEEFDKIIEYRLNRERKKFSDYETLREKADRLEALEAEMSSDQEKAARKAREEALQETSPRLVRAEFKAAAKGVLSAEQLTALLEDLDLSKFVDKKGEVDEEKVERKIKALAGTKQQDSNGSGHSAGFGQGNRQPARMSAREQGAAEAAKRFAKKTA